ncbi:helix-turn-helix domain-containing protein [Mucilaginibacter sp. FT3.2]|uniref:helix-turn-helix domain-containing protein n=1 Tax=Mucilaginibacter sp. FT3.2 TaxID=2723090 RepID=UPI0016217911|nr:helix-turn-helix transcriptional regulator [Mucilaginibacter sp. FT3.2]MBB6234166.1 transcriptional regulator with XRE-family HTH domain [Mucilaginibacter sp. FT3.2]
MTIVYTAKEKLEVITFKIRQTREFKNYSQKYLATKLNISQNAYSKIELGQTSLTVERLLIIAQILDINIIELVAA